MPCHCALTLFLTMAQSVLPGQQPSTIRSQPLDEVRRQVAQDLESADPRRVAWGVYLAGVYQFTAAVSTLQRMLESPPAMTERERPAFVDVVLDALIQLNARLPAPLVARYAEMRPVQSLALLTNSIDRDPTLLHLFSRTSGTPWYGLANLLLQDRAPGFAGQLLKTLQLRLNLTVSDIERGVGSGAGASVWATASGKSSRLSASRAISVRDGSSDGSRHPHDRATHGLLLSHGLDGISIWRVRGQRRRSE